MKKSLSVCVKETERKEEKKKKKIKSCLCLGVWGLCCFDSTPSRIFFSFFSARTAGRKHRPPPSRADALHRPQRNATQRNACASNRDYAKLAFRRGTSRSSIATRAPAARAGPCSTSPRLLVECSCGSREPEICSSRKRAAQNVCDEIAVDDTRAQSR